MPLAKSSSKKRVSAIIGFLSPSPIFLCTTRLLTVSDGHHGQVVTLFGFAYKLADGGGHLFYELTGLHLILSSSPVGKTGRCLVFVLFVLENDDTQNDEYDDCYYM